MNIRRFTTRVDDGRIVLRLFVGHATEAVPHEFEIDPGQAVVLAGQLEAAVHQLSPGFGAPAELENQTSHAALVAASAARPIE